MLRIHKILFPTDFSKFSKRAVSHVGYWAARFGAEIHLLHVIRRQKKAADVEGKMAAIIEGVHKAFAKYAKPNNDKPVIIPIQLNAIDPSAEIIRYAGQENIDLIIQATHGRSGFQRFFLGSVAEKVVSTARCSVLTVRKALSLSREHGHRILVPTDLSANASSLVAHAVAFAVVFDSEIHLLHVMEDTSSVILYRTGRKSWLEHQTTVMGQAQQDLERLAVKADYPKITFEVKKGNVLSEIERATLELSADMIMIATKGDRKGWETPLGSVAQGVIYNIDTQVFTLHCYGRSLLENVVNG